ncbi:hypothetical protein TNCV_3703161 [Trichonephila clavipes]|nr:hypothetical protein TNCV_3703161 [Trichonephila clavipes]
MNIASSHTPKSTASYLVKKESETGMEPIPFDEIPVKSPNASPIPDCVTICVTAIHCHPRRGLFWRPLEREIRGQSEAPAMIRKAILDPRIKADSEPEKLYMREPDWMPLQLKTCDTAIPESTK